MFTTSSKSKELFSLNSIKIIIIIINTIQCQSRIQAQKELSSLAISTFPIPGDADFPLNGMFVKPAHDELG